MLFNERYDRAFSRKQLVDSVTLIWLGFEHATVHKTKRQPNRLRFDCPAQALRLLVQRRSSSLWLSHLILTWQRLHKGHTKSSSPVEKRPNMRISPSIEAGALCVKCSHR
jgi:hypothetical protein